MKRLIKASYLVIIIFVFIALTWQLFTAPAIKTSAQGLYPLESEAYMAGQLQVRWPTQTEINDAACHLQKRIKGMTPSQRNGLRNNIKGFAFELLVNQQTGWQRSLTPNWPDYDATDSVTQWKWQTKNYDSLSCSEALALLDNPNIDGLAVPAGITPSSCRAGGGETAAVRQARLNGYIAQGRIFNSPSTNASVLVGVDNFINYAENIAQCSTPTPTATRGTPTPTIGGTAWDPVPVPTFEFEWYWLQSLLQALAALAAAGIDPPLPPMLIAPGNYMPPANEVVQTVQMAQTLSDTYLYGELETNLTRLEGDLEAEWYSTANNLFQYTNVHSDNAMVYDEDGNFVGSGAVDVLATRGNAMVVGNVDYFLTGTGDLSFYAPALSELAASGNWSSYNVSATGNMVIAVEGGAVTVDGVVLSGRHTIETTDAVIVGSGYIAVPDFSISVTAYGTNSYFSVGEADGTLTMASTPLEVIDGLSFKDYTGDILIYEEGFDKNSVFVNGTPNYAFKLSTVPTTTITAPNTAVSFQAQIDANFDDTYTTTVKAPIGWEVSMDANGLVTALPPTGVQPDDYPILVAAQSQTYPELVVYTEHVVTTTPYQGMALDIADNDWITVPWGPEAETNLLFPGTNNGQVQIPNAAYTIIISNTSTVSHTFEVNVNGLPAGWPLLSGVPDNGTTTEIFLPPGGVGQIGLYVLPATTVLPIAGTEYPFTVTAVDLDGANLSQNTNSIFTMPPIAFNQLTATPGTIYVAPDNAATFETIVKNIGNTAGTFPITVTLPVTTWTASYAASTGVLPTGSTHTQTVSFTPVGAIIGTNKTIQVDSSVPGTEYTQSTFVQVAVRSQETVCAYEAVQAAPDTDPGLVAALNNLLVQLDLWTTLNDLTQRDRTVAAIQDVNTQLNSYSGLTVISQLDTIATQISGHTDPVDLAGDRSTLGNVLCGDLNPVLTLISSYNPSLSLFPTIQATVPGRTITTTVTVINYGDSPATAEFMLSDIPAGWTVITPTALALQPGVPQQVPLSITPNVLGTDAVSITLHFTEAPGLVVTRSVVVRVVSELLSITDTQLDPSFLNVGTGTTDVSIQLANPAGLRASTNADVQVTDAAGVVRKNLVTPFTVAVNNSGPFLLGAIDIDGLEQGIYTTTVRLLDQNGTVIPNAVGYAHLAIGQNLHVTYDHSPVLVAPGESGISVTTVITTERTDVLTGTVNFSPVLKWAKSSFSVQGTYNQVINMPAVADINQDGIPDIIFTTYLNDRYTTDGILRVISGDDGSELLNITSYRVNPLSSPLVVDLENDGVPEIIAERDAGGLYAFSNTGGLKYTSPNFANPQFGSTPAVADMNGDGLPEIIVGRYVLNNTLSTVTDLGNGSGPGGGSEPLMTGLVADANLDGQLDVIVSNTIYTGTGGIMVQNPSLPTYGVTNGIGNFDTDPYPEIVLVFADPDFVGPFNGGNNSQVYLLDHELNVIWGPVYIPRSVGGEAGGNGGAPTIADFDGDGMPEIGIAGHSNYAVLDTDGTILWLQQTRDYSSGYTGSSVFDFEGDGRAEVVYADEQYLRVYDGPTGNELFRTARASITGYELPVTADVDGDGHAEIVVVNNNFFCGYIVCGGSYTGIRVYESSDDSWVSTRQIWNQHAYDVVSIDDNLQVVSDPTPNWLLYNTFRSQAPTPVQGNSYFVDIEHGLVSTGAPVIAASVNPVPVDLTSTRLHWIYDQQDREQYKQSQLGQTLIPALQPGEARAVSTGTVIQYTINNNRTVLTVPPLYVSAPHIISITPDINTATLGSSAVYTVTLTNAFSTTQTIHLDVWGIASTWVSISDTVTLNSGEVTQLPLLVTIPTTADLLDYTLLVQASLVGGGEDVTSAVLSVQEGPQLLVSPSLQFVRHGELVTYTVTLTNTTSDVEQYTFTATGLEGLPVNLPTPVNLAPGESSTGILTVTAQTEERTIPFTVQAGGTHGLSATDEAGLGLLNGPGVAAALAPTTAIAGRGAPAVYTLTVTNTGSIVDTYTFNVDLPTGWSYELLANGSPVTTLALTPYVFNQADFRLLVTPDAAAVPALYPVQVTVISSDPGTTGTAVAQAQVAPQGVQVSIAPQNVTMNPTGSQTWDVTVTNTGDAADTFTLSAGGIISATAQFVPASTSLSPGASTVVQLTAGNLDFALPTTYPFVVVARSTTNPDVSNFDDAEVTFSGFEDVIMTITPTLKVVDGFVSDHQFLMVVTNTGNISTLYNLSSTISPAGVAVAEKDQLYIPAHMAAVVLLHVSVPAADTYNITVQAISTSSTAADTAAATLIINSLNTDPVAVNDSATTPEDTAVTTTVLANDTDADGDTLTVTNVTQPANGTTTTDGTTVTYIPNPNFNGADSYTYTVNDGNGGIATATVSITVSPVNDDPTAIADTPVTDEDTAVTIDVLSNDSDVDGDTLSVTAVSTPTHGTATTDGTTVLYTPDANYNGLDNFTYTVGDSHGGSASAVVNVTVTPVNDDPTAVDDAITTSENISVTVSVLANDTDIDGDTLTVTTITSPTNGVAVLNPDNTVTYTPTLGFNGSDSFSYTVSDGHGGNDTALVTVTVSFVNDNPIATDDDATTDEDTAVTINVLSNDTDGDGDTLSVTTVSTPTHGTVTTDGTTVLYTPDANYYGLDTFTYTIADGHGGSDTATVTVTVNPVNDDPVAVDDSATTDEDTAVTINVLNNDSDIDGDTLSMTAVSTPTHGTATTDGTTVLYTPDANYNGLDNFTYTVGDSHGGSNTATVTVTVNPVNDDPVAADDTATTNEDTAVTINVLNNDSDIDGDTLSVTAVSTPTHGIVVNNGADVTYTPDANYNGLDNFTYTVGDGHGGSDTATVTVTVNPLNDAPTAIDDDVTTAEDTPVIVSVLVNDSDVDGDTLTVNTVTQPGNGAVIINPDNTVTYTPDPDFNSTDSFNGTDTFTYTISDGNGGLAAALVTVTVTPVNDAPVANDDTANTPEDTAVIIDVLANDSDVEGDVLTVISASTPVYGVVVINLDNSITYTPTANFNGSDSFTYTVGDGNGGFDTANVTMMVTPVNDAPVAVDDSATTDEDTAVTVNVLSNDSDIDGDTLSVTDVTTPTHGLVVINPDNTVTYTPAGNYNGVDSFSYTISDGSGGSDSALVTITITPVNDAPVAVADSAATAEDTAITVTVLSNDSDVDGDILTVDSVTQPAHGSVTYTSADVTYTPAANYNGPDSFTYTVSDGNGGFDTANVTMTVTPVNDAPVAVDDSATTDEDTAVTVNILSNDSDVDGDTLTVESVTQPEHGTLTINLDNSITYTPDADYNGTDAFSYTMSDGLATNTASVTITVTPVNDVPVAVDDVVATAEDTAITIPVLANDSDVDGDLLTVTAVTGASNGIVVINPDNTVTYTPTAAFNGTDSFTYTVSDGLAVDTALVTITVSAENDNPVANDDSATTAEDTPVTISVLANDFDVDGDTLTVSSVTQPAHGTAVINPNDTITYVPDANYNGSDSFAYTITDGHGGSDTASVTLTVTPVNDAPVAHDDSATTAEDTAITVDVLANDDDVDGDTLLVTGVTTPTHGTTVINPDNTITYTPDPNFNGSDTFIYTINDGHGGSDTAAVVVAVTPVNDAPVANDDTGTTAEDTAVTLAVLSNDSDVDGDTLAVASITQPVNGTVTTNGTTVTYTPAANFNGTDSFSYTTHDGNGSSDTAMVIVTVTPVNDAPIATDDNATTLEDTAVTIAVLANDSDIEGDSLTVSAVTQAGNGAVVINPDNTVTYTPDPDFNSTDSFNGTDVFSYTVTDGSATAMAVVTVIVTPVNDAPIANDDSATTDEDTAVTVDALANDDDVDGDTLVVTAVTTATNGIVLLNADNTITYTPDPNFNGIDSFAYTISDGQGAADTATVIIAVSPVNDTPTAADDTATTAEDTAVTVNVLANDTDVDGDTLSVTAVTTPGHGTVVINPDESITYTPDANYNGVDSFSYTVSDGNGGSDTAVVTITVTPVNDVPTANDDSVITAEDTAVTVDVLANDTDVDGDALVVESVTQPGNGLVVINPDNTVTYTPALGFNGTDNFTYTASDNHGGFDTAVVTIVVTAANDNPVAHDDTATTAEDTAVTVNVLANDTDVDGDTLSVTAVTTPGHGTVVINPDESVTYTPDANYNGVDSFSYTVSDGNGGSDTALVTVTVTSVNDLPVANDDSATTPQDTAVTVDVLANDTDVDGDALVVESVTQPGNGLVIINPDNTVTYTPALGFNGTDNFTYTASDGNGGSDTATVTITVTPTAAACNLYPIALHEETLAGAEVGDILSDIFNGSGPGNFGWLTWTGDNGVPALVASLTAPGNSYTYINPYDPNDHVVSTGDWVRGKPGVSNSHDVREALDALKLIDITVPVWDDAAGSGSHVKYEVTTFATVRLISYHLPKQDRITVQFLGYTSCSVSNTPPVAMDDAVSTLQDTSVTIDALLNDSDEDGDPLAVQSVALPGHGTAVILTDNTVTYTPDAGFVGTDSFLYTISDGQGGTDTATITISVTPVVGACELYPIALHTNTLNGAEVGDILDNIYNGSYPGKFGWLTWNGDTDTDALLASLVPPGNSHIYVNPYDVNDYVVSVGDWVWGKPGVANGHDIREVLDELKSLDITVPIWDDVHGYGGSLRYQVAAFARVRLLSYQLSHTDRITVQFLGYTTCTGSGSGLIARNDAAETRKDTAVTISVLANDSAPDGGSLTLQNVSTPAHGTAVINANGTVTYIPNPSFLGTDSFVYTVSDNEGNTDTATVTVRVSRCL